MLNEELKKLLSYSKESERVRESTEVEEGNLRMVSELMLCRRLAGSERRLLDVEGRNFTNFINLGPTNQNPKLGGLGYQCYTNLRNCVVVSFMCCLVISDFEAQNYAFHAFFVSLV